VTYNYRFQDLTALLHTKAPALADALAASHRHVDDGLLSVGLKVHCLDVGHQSVTKFWVVSVATRAVGLI